MGLHVSQEGEGRGGPPPLVPFCHPGTVSEPPSTPPPSNPPPPPWYQHAAICALHLCPHWSQCQSTRSNRQRRGQQHEATEHPLQSQGQDACLGVTHISYSYLFSVLHMGGAGGWGCSEFWGSLRIFKKIQPVSNFQIFCWKSELSEFLDGLLLVWVTSCCQSAAAKWQSDKQSSPSLHLTLVFLDCLTVHEPTNFHSLWSLFPLFQHRLKDPEPTNVHFHLNDGLCLSKS